MTSSNRQFHLESSIKVVEKCSSGRSFATVYIAVDECAGVENTIDRTKESNNELAKIQKKTEKKEEKPKPLRNPFIGV